MFWMNKDIKDLKNRMSELNESEKLKKKRISELEEQIEKLKLQKKIEEEDIKHMVKMKMEQLEIEHKKAMLDMEKEKEEIISRINDEYRNKIEAFLQNQVKDVKEMYSQILERLPDINLRLKGNV